MPNIQASKTFFPHKHSKISNSKNFLSNKTLLFINYFIVLLYTSINKTMNVSARSTVVVNRVLAGAKIRPG